MSKKIKEFLSILPGAPIGAEVVDGHVGYAIQAWKRRFKDSGLMKELHARKEFTKPSAKRRKIVLNAMYLQRKDKSNNG